MADEFPTLIVEAGFGGPPALGDTLILDDPTRGLLDTGTLGDEIASFTNITQWVHSGSIRRGSSRVNTPVVQYEAGTCTIVLDNSDRRFDPTNLGGPYVDAGATLLLPMRPIRIRASYDDGGGSVTYELFRGFVDSWGISYNGPNYSQCILTATDAFKVLGSVDRVAVSPVGAGETSGARLNRILDDIDWPDVDRDIATGDSTVQSTDLSGNALTEIQLVGETELGDFYIDTAGRTKFVNRHDSWATVSDQTFIDDDADYPYESVAIDYSDTTIFNDIRITRDGGSVQSASDSDSQDYYLRRTYDRSGLLMQTNAAALEYAQALLYIAKDPELRFSSMVVNPRKAAATLFPEVLGRDFGTRITVQRTPPGGGDPIERDVIIRGVEHSWTAAITWKTTWVFQSATTTAFLVLDDAVQGILDSNALGF